MRRDLPIPERLLLPPAPRGPGATVWDEATFAQRRRLAGLLHQGTVPDDDRAVVAGLARRRLATTWRLRAVAVGLGWLVLMTIWGFGRATTGRTVTGWLWLGLAAAAVAATLHWRATSRRRARWVELAASG